MPKTFRKWVLLGAGFLVLAIIVIAFLSKPVIRHRALGGPVRIIEVDESLLKRGFLGISYEAAQDDQLTAVGLQNGVRITQIFNGGPAESAGIAIGDFLTKVDDSPLKDPDQVRTVSQSWKPGQILKLTFVHPGGARPTLQVADVELITFGEMKELMPREE